MTRELDVFVSSKMVELKPERDMLWDLIPTLLDGVIRLRPRIYERDAPASNNPTRQVYLDILKKSALYVGLFWNEYGVWTIDEFTQAGDCWIDRLIFVKNVEPERRDTQLAEFLRENSDVLTSPANVYFETEAQLKDAVAHSIEEWVVTRLYKEQQRRKLSEHYEAHREPLYRALREYTDYLADHPTTATKDDQRHWQIIAQAINTCVAINDSADAECTRCLGIEAEQDGYQECSQKYEKNLTYIAFRRLTPNCVVGTEGTREEAEAARWGWYGNRNRNALFDAVHWLNEHIRMLER